MEITCFLPAHGRLDSAIFLEQFEKIIVISVLLCMFSEKLYGSCILLICFCVVKLFTKLSIIYKHSITKFNTHLDFFNTDF